MMNSVLDGDWSNSVLGRQIPEGLEEETPRHFVVECRELQEIRRQYGVYGTEALEEVLIFMEKNKEKVSRCKKMLEEMWRVRRRRIEQS